MKWLVIFQGPDGDWNPTIYELGVVTADSAEEAEKIFRSVDPNRQTAEATYFHVVLLDELATTPNWTYCPSNSCVP